MNTGNSKSLFHPSPPHPLSLSLVSKNKNKNKTNGNVTANITQNNVLSGHNDKTELTKKSQ